VIPGFVLAKEQKKERQERFLPLSLWIDQRRQGKPGGG
jgi:hypothetical protein